jgi:anti-sigma factor RsiW
MTIPDSHLDPVLLSAYLDDEVTTRERDLVENHLVTCEACNLELESLSWTVNLLGQLPQVPPPRTFYVTEAMLEPEVSPTLPWWDLRRWLSVPWTPVTAALAAMLLLVIITQATSFNLLPATPQAEIAVVGEAPPTLVPGIQLTTVPVAARSAEAEEEGLESGTALSAPAESTAEFSPTNPEEAPVKAEVSNSQTQPLVLVVAVTALIFLFTMGFVWSRRK